MFQRRKLRAFKPVLVLAFIVAGICVFPTESMAGKKAKTPDLVRAVRDGQDEKINDLLKRNKDINAQDDYGWTPLMYAVLRKDNSLVERLLSNGADPNLPDQDGVTPLIAAIIQMSQPFMVQYLSPAERDIKPTALILIEKGADPNLADKEGNTPLIYAVITSQEQVVTALLAKGADPNKPDSYGRTPLFFLKNSDQAAKWAPANGALSYRLRGRRIQPDESLFTAQYATQVAQARAQANVMLDQIKANMTVRLENAGAAPIDSKQIQAAGDPLIDSPPRRLGGVGPGNALDEVMRNFLRTARGGFRYDLLVCVTAEGTVKTALVLSGLKGISEQLQKAAMKLRYQPAMKKGQPVEDWDRVVGSGTAFRR